MADRPNTWLEEHRELIAFALFVLFCAVSPGLFWLLGLTPSCPAP